MIFVFVGEL